MSFYVIATAFMLIVALCFCAYAYYKTLEVADRISDFLYKHPIEQWFFEYQIKDGIHSYHWVRSGLERLFNQEQIERKQQVVHGIIISQYRRKV
jgi:hypothetical protein